jgi:integrase
MATNIYKHENGRWYIKVQINGQRVHRAAGTSKQAAQLLLASLIRDAERGDLGLPKHSDVTFEQWAPKYIEWAQTTKRPNSIEADTWQMKILIDRFGPMKLYEITRERAMTFMEDRAREELPKRPGRIYAKASVNRLAALLKKVLSLACEKGVVDENPLRGLRLFKEVPRIAVLGSEDEARLMESCGDRDWLRWTIRVALQTGMRQEEIIALTWDRVDLESGVVLLQQTKSGRPRIVPLHGAIIDELRRRRGLPGALVCPGPEGAPLSRHSLTHAFRRAADQAGLRGFRYHDLRHAFATRFRAAGASTLDTMEVLGHASPSMSQKYAHGDLGHMKRLAARAAGSSPAEAFDPEALVARLTPDQRRRLLDMLLRIDAKEKHG